MLEKMYRRVDSQKNSKELDYVFNFVIYHNNNYSVHTGSRLEYYSREGERDPLRGYDEGTGMAHNAGPPLLYGYGYSGRCGA